MFVDKLYLLVCFVCLVVYNLHMKIMKNHHKHRERSDESGNAIWFILLAVVLLSALTIAITRSSDSVEQSGDRERARVAASEIMRYAKGIEQTIEQMRHRGIGENEISFENSFVSGYTNARCTSTSCRIFDREGGGQVYREPPPLWLDSSFNAEDHYGTLLFTGNACIPNVGAYGGETGANCTADTGNLDLLMVVPFIRESLCLEINRLVEMGTGGAAPPQDANASWDGTIGDAQFTGIYTDAQSISHATLDGGDFTTGCFEGNTNPAGGYHFYHVLLARPGG